jgi:hypothetical protein
MDADEPLIPALSPSAGEKEMLAANPCLSVFILVN